MKKYSLNSFRVEITPVSHLNQIELHPCYQNKGLVIQKLLHDIKYTFD